MTMWRCAPTPTGIYVRSSIVFLCDDWKLCYYWKLSHPGQTPTGDKGPTDVHEHADHGQRAYQALKDVDRDQITYETEKGRKATSSASETGTSTCSLENRSFPTRDQLLSLAFEKSFLYVMVGLNHTRTMGTVDVDTVNNQLAGVGLGVGTDAELGPIEYFHVPEPFKQASCSDCRKRTDDDYNNMHC